MALSIPYGVDPDETWELDFAAESARYKIGALRRVAEGAREQLARAKPEEKEALDAFAKRAEEQALKLEGELAGYVPSSGPVFIVGPIPNGKRAELFGESVELERLGEGHEREKFSRDRAWSEEVVRFAVREHRNLLSGKSRKPIGFQAETIQWAGEPRQVVSRKTLESYAAILGDLAVLVLRSQRMDEAGKNA